MKSNSRMVSAALVGLSTWFVACYVQGALKRHQKRITKKSTKEAVHAWEGEGGAIIDAAPRQ